jgi:hypothetical protein
MAICTAREIGITCEADGCGGEFALGEEYLYFYGNRLHQRCASADAAGRRDGDEDAADAARSILASGSRVVLSRSQLRGLIAIVMKLGLEPVRKPDTGRQRWYGRMSGWSADRVNAGLAASEVAGLWQDFLDAGRMPPLRGRDLSVIMDVIDRNVINQALTSTVTKPLSALVPLP